MYLFLPCGKLLNHKNSIISVPGRKRLFRALLCFTVFMFLWTIYRMLSSSLDVLNLFILDSLIKPSLCLFSILIVEDFKLSQLRIIGLSRNNALSSLLKGLMVTSIAWLSSFILVPFLLYGTCTLEFERNLAKIAIFSINFILISGPFEEIFFRGYIFGQIRLAFDTSRLKLLAAIFFSSALFSLSHLPIHLFVWKSGFYYTLLFITFAFIIGNLLAFIYLVTGNLFGAIVAHIEWNILSAFISIEELSTFHSYGLALVVFATVFAFTSLLLYYLSNQRIIAKL
ncbi:MAG: hypothetical protein DRJ38_08795 [Thermoprotei archaeon]|nr:MAG: hypothetical protein DRJ38_08795 [Thermoprotei archaeon]